MRSTKGNGFLVESKKINTVDLDYLVLVINAAMINYNQGDTANPICVMNNRLITMCSDKYYNDEESKQETNIYTRSIFNPNHRT